MCNKLNDDEMKVETPERVRVICFVTTRKNLLYEIRLFEMKVEGYVFEYNMVVG